MLQITSREPAMDGLSKLRVQVLLGALLSVILPTVLRAKFDVDSMLSASNLNTIAACFTAMLIGAVLFRSFKAYPGVRSYEYVLPVYLASYGMVAAFLLVTRLDYVRSTLITSFVLSIALFFVICLIENRLVSLISAYVPGGAVDRLGPVRNVEWHPLTEPTVPHFPCSGIVADFRVDLDDAWQRMLADATLAGVRVYHVKQLIESMTGQLDIEHLSENNFGSLSPSEGYGKLKRAIDVASAMLCLPLLLPLLALIAVATRLDSPGPALFRQQRVGFRGKPFTIIKFRTMHMACERDVPGMNSAMTVASDCRVTRIGKLLRRTRIDEIPQIINVLRGEMSWIGPRPEEISLSAWYNRELAFYSYRHVIRPGITGWAQVNQGHVVDLHAVKAKLGYDFYYIKYVSAGLDILIMLRTIRTILTGDGAK